MSKDIVFVGVKSPCPFEYSPEAIYCYSCILRLEQITGNDSVSLKSILEFFGIDFSSVKSTKISVFYRISKEDVEKIKESYLYAKSMFTDFIKLDKEELVIELLKTKEGNSDIFKTAALADALEIKEKENGLMVPERLFKIVFLKAKFDKDVFQNTLLLMNELNYNLSLSSFFNNRFMKKTLLVLQLTDFESLLDVRIDFLYSFFINYYDYLLTIIKSFNKNPFEDFANEIDLLTGKMSSKSPVLLDVFKRRYSIGYPSKMTLEEIGVACSVTRERIRQIEAKAKDYIFRNGTNINRTISMLLLSSIKQNSYVSRKQLEESFNDSIYVDYLCALVDCLFNSEFEYDYFLQCFFRKGELKNIEEELISEYPYAISKVDYENFDSTKKGTAKKFYNFVRDSFYIKKGVSYSEFVLVAFDELFPDGGRISEENCTKLSAHLLAKYDIKSSFTPHNLQSYLTRNDYCFVNRGTFINRKYAASLSDELFQRILSFINESNELLYYSTIFHKFEKELNVCRINNWFYLKGVLDPMLPSNIRTKRDYCCKETYKGNVTTHFDDLIKKHKGIITLKEFLQENPGVKEYVLYNYANYNDDKILWLSNKTFVDASYIKIPAEISAYIKADANRLFDSLNTNVITDSKLFAKIKLLHPNLLEMVPFVQNAFDFYSLVKYLLPNDFYYNRPFISRDNDNITYARIIRNYLITLDRFDLHILQSYCYRMHLRIYNYLEILINMSDDFVQISKDTCINKNVFKITNEQIEDIKNLLLYYMNSFGSMDLRTFKGYDVFPKLNYNWNEYLLIGIVTSFFNELFEIEYTDNQYNTTSFIVRRR